MWGRARIRAHVHESPSSLDVVRETDLKFLTLWFGGNAIEVVVDFGFFGFVSGRRYS